VNPRSARRVAGTETAGVMWPVTETGRLITNCYPSTAQPPAAAILSKQKL
jgi:hypothetical protein